MNEDKKPPKSTNTFGHDFSRGITYTIPETLNKREMIAAMAMQGILASLTDDMDVVSPREVAISALRNADALLAELEKTK